MARFCATWILRSRYYRLRRDPPHGEFETLEPATNRFTDIGIGSQTREQHSVEVSDLPVECHGPLTQLGRVGERPDTVVVTQVWAQEQLEPQCSSAPKGKAHFQGGPRQRADEFPIV
jgi:hypothetical protein